MIVECKEKGGTVFRTVRPMLKDHKHLQTLAKKLEGVPNFLDKTDWRAMLAFNFVAVEVDDVGLVAMDKLRPGEDGRVHVTFWDKRLRGREELCRRIAHMWMERYNLGLVYTSIPLESKVVLMFCHRVGFKSVSISDGYVHLVMPTKDYLHDANSTRGVS